MLFQRGQRVLHFGHRLQHALAVGQRRRLQQVAVRLRLGLAQAPVDQRDIDQRPQRGDFVRGGGAAVREQVGGPVDGAAQADAGVAVGAGDAQFAGCAEHFGLACGDVRTAPQQVGGYRVECADLQARRCCARSGGGRNGGAPRRVRRAARQQHRQPLRGGGAGGARFAQRGLRLQLRGLRLGGGRRRRQAQIDQRRAQRRLPLARVGDALQQLFGLLRMAQFDPVARHVGDGGGADLGEAGLRRLQVAAAQAARGFAAPEQRQFPLRVETGDQERGAGIGVDRFLGARMQLRLQLGRGHAVHAPRRAQPGQRLGHVEVVVQRLRHQGVELRIVEVLPPGAAGRPWGSRGRQRCPLPRQRLRQVGQRGTDATGQRCGAQHGKAGQPGGTAPAHAVGAALAGNSSSTRRPPSAERR
ncbi:hypothetical protein ABFU84_09370 [Xanthomonas translucens pv. undulosa]